MHQTEWTALGLATYQHAHLRTYAAQWVDASRGERVLLQPCEEWIDGRWEGFISELERRPAFSRN